MTIMVGDYVTVADAAALLKVHKSTIRRWIDQGELPAYRVGRRRLALKREDVARLIRPVEQPAKQANGPTGYAGRDEIPPLTPEQRERGLAAMVELRKLRAEMLRARGGVLLSESWEILNELRDERSRQLS